MRTRALLVAALSAPLVACAAPAQDDDPARWVDPLSLSYPGRREVTGVVGLRSFTDGGWKPNEDQITGGAELAWQPPLGGLELEVGVHVSVDESTADVAGLGAVELQATTTEVFLGARKSATLPWLRLRPYAGAGVALVYARLDGELDGTGAEALDDDDASFGVYGKVGIGLPLAANAFLGVEYRVLGAASFELGGTHLDGDYGQLALVTSAVF